MDGPIDSRQLQVFIALAHGGSLKAAARELVVTESAVSHAVRNLEKNLATRLFRRDGKGLALTGSGKILLRESVQILARMRDIRGQLAAEESSGGGAIHLVAATSFIRNGLRGVLAEFLRHYPETPVRVTAADRDACLELLAKGEATAAILVNLPADSPEVEGCPLFTDRMTVLMSESHPLAQRASLPVHALCRETVYLRGQSNFTSRLILNEIGRWSFHLRNVVYLESAEATREIVRLGLGVTFESPWTLGRPGQAEGLVWRSVEGLDLSRRWCFALPSATRLDEKMRTLLRLCQEAGRAIDQQGAAPAGAMASRD